MKTIDYYMQLPYKMEIVADVEEGGFLASFPDLPGCLTCGDTIEKAAENAVDAKRAWIAAALEEHLDIKEPTGESSYSGQFKLRLPKTLHRILAEQAQKEGISMNQYCIYLLSKNSV